MPVIDFQVTDRRPYADGHAFEGGVGPYEVIEGVVSFAVDPEHPPCPDCGNGLDWVQEYDRWYCYSCEKYPW